MQGVGHGIKSHEPCNRAPRETFGQSGSSIVQEAATACDGQHVGHWRASLARHSQGASRTAGTNNQRGGVRKHFIIVVLAALLGTMAVVATTSSENTADAIDYARDAAAGTEPLAPRLLEPGHLLWRPAGVVLRNFAGGSASNDPVAIRDAQRRLTFVSTITLFVAAASIGLLVSGVVGTMAAGLAAVALVTLGSAVINFAQAGAPLRPRSGVRESCAPRWHLRRATHRGMASCPGRRPPRVGRPPLASVCPGCRGRRGRNLSSFSRRPRQRLRAATIATLACAFLGMTAYLGAAWANGIRSLPAFVRPALSFARLILTAS